MECQEMLFASIKGGKVIFPVQHWDKVSSEAKDLKRQSCIKDLEDFANKAIALNKADKEDDNSHHRLQTVPVDIPVKRGTVSFDLSPLGLSTCSLLQRRRRSKDLASKFSSIDELESDFFMRAI